MARTLNASKVSLLKGRRMRVTRLDNCGRPIYGDNGFVASKGFITITASTQTSETDAVEQQNAAGEVCLYEPSETSVNGYGLEIEFCGVDFAMLELITGERAYVDEDGNIIGLASDTSVDLSQIAWALEVWMGAKGGDACDDPNAQGEYGYLLFPYVKGGYIGDISIQNGAINFTVSGASTREGNRWGSGPYDVELVGGVASPLRHPLTKGTQRLVVKTSVAPPEETGGAFPLLDPNASPITTLAANPQPSPSLTVDFSTTPVLVDTGVFVDFGDGSWDYFVGDGTFSHTYDEAGQYTVTVNTNGVPVTEVVSVPAGWS